MTESSSSSVLMKASLDMNRNGLLRVLDCVEEGQKAGVDRVMPNGGFANPETCPVDARRARAPATADALRDSIF